MILIKKCIYVCLIFHQFQCKRLQFVCFGSIYNNMYKPERSIPHATVVGEGLLSCIQGFPVPVYVLRWFSVGIVLSFLFFSELHYDTRLDPSSGLSDDAVVVVCLVENVSAIDVCAPGGCVP